MNFLLVVSRKNEKVSLTIDKVNILSSVEPSIPCHSLVKIVVSKDMTLEKPKLKISHLKSKPLLIHLKQKILYLKILPNL